MKIDIWMPFFINDWLADTTELNAEGQGIYLLLVLSIWKKGTLPNDIQKLCRIARTDDTELLQEILDDYFCPTTEGFSHHRVEREMKIARKNREKAAENGRKGGRPRKNDNPEKTHSITQKKPTGFDSDNPEVTHSITQDEAKLNPEKSSSPSPIDKKNKENFKRKQKSETPIPSIEEIEEYRLELESGVEAEVFFDYYQARGWKWKSTLIEDWQAVFRNWDRRLRKAQGQDSRSATAPAADHLGTDEEVPEEEIQRLLSAVGA